MQPKNMEQIKEFSQAGSVESPWTQSLWGNVAILGKAKKHTSEKPKNKRKHQVLVQIPLYRRKQSEAGGQEPEAWIVSLMVMPNRCVS